MKVRNVSNERQQIEDLYVTLQSNEAIDLGLLYGKARLNRSNKLKDLLRRGILIEYKEAVAVVEGGTVTVKPPSDPISEQNLKMKVKKKQKGDDDSILSVAVSKENVVELKSERGEPQVSIRIKDEPEKPEELKEPVVEVKETKGSIIVDLKKDLVVEEVVIEEKSKKKRKRRSRKKSSRKISSKKK